MVSQPCHLMAQEQFASHRELTLEVVRTLENSPDRRLWLLRCTDCGQYYRSREQTGFREGIHHYLEKWDYKTIA